MFNKDDSACLCCGLMNIRSLDHLLALRPRKWNALASVQPHFAQSGLFYQQMLTLMCLESTRMRAWARSADTGTQVYHPRVALNEKTTCS